MEPKYANPYDAVWIYASGRLPHKTGNGTVPAGLSSHSSGLDTDSTEKRHLFENLLRSQCSGHHGRRLREEVMVLIQYGKFEPDKIYTLKDEGSKEAIWSKGKDPQMVLSKIPRIRWEKVDDVKGLEPTGRRVWLIEV